MKVIEPGHVYEVENVDGKGTQRIQFVHRRDSTAELLPDKERKEGIQSSGASKGPDRQDHLPAHRAGVA